MYIRLLLALLALPFLTQADDLKEKSDEFNSAVTLGNWRFVNETENTPKQLERLGVGDGVLTLVPYTSVWYQDYRGILIYKEITGDFIVTTKLKVTGRDGKSAPKAEYSLAGLLVRTPREVTPKTWKAGGENYIFISMGAADQPGKNQIEIKTTVNSRSRLQISSADSNEGELRVARLGNAIISLVRMPGKSWVVQHRYQRSDFPSTLQVGITCYTDWATCKSLSVTTHNTTVIKNGNPDLIAKVDYVRFRPPTLPAALQGKRLDNPYEVPDEQLLAFLGATAD